jgi:hypothetical protein
MENRKHETGNEKPATGNLLALADSSVSRVCISGFLFPVIHFPSSARINS